MSATQAKVHVIHENAEWSQPLFAALDRLGVPYADWHMAQGTLDLGQAPPAGVFYNRMSASSHTRDHRYSPEYTAAVLNWLERHESRVLNGTEALRLELSKVAQHQALDALGIRTPKTLATLGETPLLEAAIAFKGHAFITKHNRAGKGLGVKLFHEFEDLRGYVQGPSFEPSVDGITLVQEYIQAPTPHITRVEFIGGELLYAVRVDTSAGFELCPAQSCSVEDVFCPAGAGAKFEILDDFDHPLLSRYQTFLKHHEIAVAAFEFIDDDKGRSYTYDINTNTNYNPQAEAAQGVYGMQRLAQYLAAELASQKHGTQSRQAA